MNSVVFVDTLLTVQCFVVLDDFDDEVMEPKPVKAAVKTKEIKTITVKASTKPAAPLTSHITSRAKPSSRGEHHRKAPTSTVGAVLKHDIEDNDEYDPLRPAIGNVASVVRAPPRRWEYTLL